MSTVERLRRDHMILRNKLDVIESAPIFERTLAQAESKTSDIHETPRIDEAMTVNRVVGVFPTTRPVFERLFISLPAEGCTCLDEVAWRHGMESWELLDRLDAALHPTTASRRSPGRIPQSCECVGKG